MMTAATLTMDRPMPVEHTEEPGMARFSAWLRHHMEARGLSQRQVAAYADVAPTTVGLWMKGYSVPKPESLKKLADGLGQGVTYNFLVSLIDANLQMEAGVARYDAAHDELDEKIEAWLRQGMELLRLRRRHTSGQP